MMHQAAGPAVRRYPDLYTRPESCHLWTSRGVQLAGYLAEPSLAAVRRRLEGLSEADLERQRWLVRAALCTVATERDEVGTGKAAELPVVLADRAALLDASRRMGDRLEELALHEGPGVAWLGLQPSAHDGWTLARLSTDLYGGLPGVALFLAYLGGVAGEPRYTRLAEETLAALRYQLDHERAERPAIGGFSGLGGVIYTLAHLAALWDRPDLLAEAEMLVARLPGLIDDDQNLDVLSGAAGCIGGLVALQRCAPSQPTLQVALRCGDHLLAQARPTGPGIGWLIPGAGPAPLAGFSHGAAGIAWALLELSGLTGVERFRTAACAALAYESGLFSPELGNWRDLRTMPDAPEAEGPAYCTAWCHGAPGIGLARLHGLRHLDNAEVRAGIAAALRTTQTRGIGGNHSLCHGDLGNLDLFLAAGQILGDGRWRTQALRVATRVLTDIGSHGWRSGTPLEVESPGLMTGLAGIGYELLRMAEPERVPSVLVLEPPQAG